MQRYWAVGGFTLAYMLGFGAIALANGNREFIFYWAVMLVIVALVWTMDRRVRLTWAVLWGLALWGLLHMGGGTVPIPESMTEPGGKRVLYSLRVHPGVPKYDQFVHAFGFGVATLAAWQALRAATGDTLRPTFGPVTAAVCIGMGLGAINELIEFIATRLLPETNVGGYENTGWDLVSNFTGCLIAGALNAAKPGPASSAGAR